MTNNLKELRTICDRKVVNRKIDMLGLKEILDRLAIDK